MNIFWENVDIIRVNPLSIKSDINVAPTEYNKFVVFLNDEMLSIDDFTMSQLNACIDSAKRSQRVSIPVEDIWVIIDNTDPIAPSFEQRTLKAFMKVGIFNKW